MSNIDWEAVEIINRWSAIAMMEASQEMNDDTDINVSIWDVRGRLE